jgi:hypothetical protein
VAEMYPVEVADGKRERPIPARRDAAEDACHETPTGAGKG